MPRTTGEINRSRQFAERQLVETCSVIRPSDTLSDSGYPTDSDTTVLSNVPCLIQRATSDPFEASISGQVQAVSEFVGLFPYDFEARATDVIERGDDRFSINGPDTASMTMYGESLTTLFLTVVGTGPS